MGRVSISSGEFWKNIYDEILERLGNLLYQPLVPDEIKNDIKRILERIKDVYTPKYIEDLIHKYKDAIRAKDPKAISDSLAEIRAISKDYVGYLVDCIKEDAKKVMSMAEFLAESELDP